MNGFLSFSPEKSLLQTSGSGITVVVEDSYEVSGTKAGSFKLTFKKLSEE
ncbi:MAG: hypothetical protein V4615_07240 [Bacteroidota bacterium]